MSDAKKYLKDAASNLFSVHVKSILLISGLHLLCTTCSAPTAATQCIFLLCMSSFFAAITAWLCESHCRWMGASSAFILFMIPFLWYLTATFAFTYGANDHVALGGSAIFWLRIAAIIPIKDYLPKKVKCQVPLVN